MDRRYINSRLYFSPHSLSPGIPVYVRPNRTDRSIPPATIQNSVFLTPTNVKQTRPYRSLDPPAMPAQQIPVPSYMKKGALFYHVTTRQHASNILVRGIDPSRRDNGTVDSAGGYGFSTVKDLASVWQWMDFDSTALENIHDDENRRMYLAVHHSVVVLELVAVPTTVYDGMGSEDAEVVVSQGGDDVVVWTERGVRLGLVEVVREIEGKVMLSEPEFERWYMEEVMLG